MSRVGQERCGSGTPPAQSAGGAPGKAGPDLNSGKIPVKAAGAGGSQPAALLAALAHEGM